MLPTGDLSIDVFFYSSVSHDVGWKPLESKPTLYKKYDHEKMTLSAFENVKMTSRITFR